MKMKHFFPGLTQASAMKHSKLDLPIPSNIISLWPFGGFTGNEICSRISKTERLCVLSGMSRSSYNPLPFIIFSMYIDTIPVDKERFFGISISSFRKETPVSKEIMVQALLPSVRESAP